MTKKRTGRVLGWVGRVVRSLRFKLIVMFVVVFGVVASLLGVVAMAIQERQLHRYFDRMLLERSNRIVEELKEETSLSLHDRIEMIVSLEMRTIYFSQFFIQLLDEQGKVLVRSNQLGEYRLPVDAIEELPEGSSRLIYETIVGEEVALVSPQYPQLRLLTRRVEVGDDKDYYMQVAANLEHVMGSTQLLKRLYIGMMLTGLLTAALASWFVVGRIVRRIKRATRVARALGPSNLSQRFAVSGVDDELSALVKSINAMLNRLEQGYHSQERFIQDASHELKTPIATLLTEAQVLKLTGGLNELAGTDGVDDEKGSEILAFVSSVENEMRMLSRMVESLLTLARVDRLEAIESVQQVSMVKVVRQACGQCEAIAEDYRIVIEQDVAEDVRGVVVEGDPNLLEVAVSNLIRNAVRYSGSGKDVVVRVRLCRGDDGATGQGHDGRVSLNRGNDVQTLAMGGLASQEIQDGKARGSIGQSHRHQDSKKKKSPGSRTTDGKRKKKAKSKSAKVPVIVDVVEVAVMDRGPGLSDEAIDRVFNRFYRAEHTSSKRGGSGLGLAIVKTVVGLHRGEVDVGNREGGGAVFSVRLPVCGRKV